MAKIVSIEGTTVLVRFDTATKDIQLPNAPVHDKDELIAFVAEREVAYAASQEKAAAGNPTDVTALAGITLSAKQITDAQKVVADRRAAEVVEDVVP